MPIFRRKNSHDSDIADCLDALSRQPLSDGQLINVELDGSATQEFVHGLKRPYRGVIIVGQSATGDVHALIPESCSDPSRRFAIANPAASARTLRVVVF